MAKAGKVSHKIGFGDSFARRMDSSGYRAREAAENVAGGYHTIAHAMKGWEESPGHRKNLLKPIINEIGMGVAQAYDKQFDFYWAMVLARPFVFATQ